MNGLFPADRPEFVTVWPLSNVPKPLVYRLPKAGAAAIQPGCLVHVPLANRVAMGVVRSFDGPGDFPVAKIKSVLGLARPFPVLTPDLLDLAEWIERYYGSPLGTVLDTMLPSAVRCGVRRRTQVWLTLGQTPSAEEWNRLARKAPSQIRLLEYLRSLPAGQRLLKQPLLARLKISAPSCAALVDKGWLRESTEELDREAYRDETGDLESVVPAAFSLNSEQIAAVESIAASLAAGQFAVHLLHGVTGSGKTEVYLQAMQTVLAAGGSVLFLVPEVALTPQTVGRLRARLEKEGFRAVVWHSFLSHGERYDAWHAIASGQARVVVGARSAIFAPLGNLRLIVVDEEHEPAFKQDDNVRYQGRDTAVYRASLTGAVCVLGSATPSLESLYNVEKGKYRLNRLNKRVDDRQLPVIHVVDMKPELMAHPGGAIFSRFLAGKLRDRLEKKEQTILFLNRRGYHTSLLCPECEYLAVCPHCSVALTHHREEKALRCHWCGYSCPAPQQCPQCQSEKIRWRGKGTQRVEEVAATLLPQAKIVRIDADSMRQKNLFRHVLGDFRQGKIDILVGTQMIAKGLDFPNVTLVGLLDADLSLHVPDFRASERTFQLLVQVAGRAGRGDRSGEVVVQSFLPHSAPIQYARHQDFDGFLKAELEERRQYRYPPFRHLIQHLFRGRNQEKVSFFADQWARFIETRLPSDIEIRGPAPAPLEKIRDLYRYQMWYFTPAVTAVLPLLLAGRREFRFDKEVVDILDVDPASLF